MSILEKACARAGVSLVADALPKGQRGVRKTQELFALIRATETEMLDAYMTCELELNESLQEVLKLQEQVHRLKAELLQQRLKETLSGFDSLTVGDRQKALAAADANGNSF